MATFTQQIDGMVCCPYDSSHRVAARNFVKHTMQCELKYKSGYVCVCPHNASHRMPKHQFADHLKTCEDLKQITRERSQYSNASEQCIGGIGLQNITINNSTESDDEWNDKAPHYDMYSCIAVSDHKQVAALKALDNESKKSIVVGQCVKETKNQKKRRKRKENAKTIKVETNDKQINSIWDITN